MTLNVNAAANATQSISTVFSGTERRRAPERSEPEAELPKGRGVRASSDIIERLDSERRQQTDFNASTDKRSQQAIAAYQSQSNAQRRGEVQALLGVDLYA